MINVNTVDHVIDKSQLQKTTADVIYKKHKAEINDIYTAMKALANAGQNHVWVTKQPEETIDWLLTFFKLKGFNVKEFEGGAFIPYTNIKISW